MPLAKRFKLGSCFGGGAAPDTTAEPKKEEPEVVKPYDFSKHSEHTVWRLAVAAAEGIKHCPAYEDAFIPWSHPSAAEGATSEVCAVAPVGGPGLATLFLRTTLSASSLANRLNIDFFDDKMGVKATGGGKGGKKKDMSSDGPKDKAPPAPPAVLLAPEGGGAPPLVIEAASGSYMYGPVLALTSTTTDAFEMLEYLESIFRTGYASLMPHKQMQTNVRTVKGIMRLTTRTGVQQADKKDKKAVPSSKSLATIFELEFDRAPKFSSPEGHRPHTLGANVVARAVIAYRDASAWTSVGPTILSIEVRRDYQGSGLVQDLFNAIERWFVKFWTLDTVKEWRCLKATQLQDFVVDLYPQVEGDDPADENHVLTDKKFLYEVMHFQCNYPNPTDPLGQLGTDVPPELHAIKLYPPAGAEVPTPTVAYSRNTTAPGWRSCDNCRVPEDDLDSSLLVCGGCRLPNYWRAHYCSRRCQREHWVIHKLCCGKSYNQVCAGKKALEESIVAAAASSSDATKA